MARYDRRNRELKDRFTLIQGKLLFEETLRMMSALERYYEQRDAVLTSITLAAKDSSDNPIKSSFSSILQDGRKRLDEILKTMLDSVREPTSEALAFQGQARVEDDFFFAGLERLRLDDARDELLKLAQNLNAYVKTLGTKWSTLSERDLQIERPQEQFILELNQAIGQSIQDGAPAFDRAGQTVTDGVQSLSEFFKDLTKTTRTMVEDYLKQTGDGSAAANSNAETWAKFLTSVFDVGRYIQGKLTPSLDRITSGYASALADQLKAINLYTNGYFTGRIQGVRNLIPNQNAILVVFSDTRKEADAFIRENGLDTAKRRFEQARSALESWPSGLSSGNQGDASDMAREIVESLERRVDDMANVFNSFVADYSGRFFGPVSNEVEQAFLNLTFWDENRRRLESWDLEARLRQWREGVQVFTVNLENAFGQLTANLADLPLPVQDAVRRAVEEAQERFLEQIRRSTEEARNTYEKASETVRSEDVKSALNRRPLQDTLKR